MPRKRSSLLEAIELLAARGLRSRPSMAVFLYACENEGATVSEIALLTRLPVATAARLVRTATLGEDGVAQPLLHIEPGENDRRLKFVSLTRAGEELRHQLDCLVDAQIMLASAPTRAGTPRGRRPRPRS